MTEEELNELVASVTPERLRALGQTLEDTFHLRRRTGVPVVSLLRALTAGADVGAGAEYRHVMARLTEAIRFAVQQMPDARFVEHS